MKKTTILMMMALLMFGMSLTSCEDILGHWEQPSLPPVATVTTAPTAVTGDILAYSAAALIATEGEADGGILMYKLTTENTKPTSTEDFEAVAPTADDLTAGVYYIWYYVKRDASHRDSEIAGPVISTVNVVDLSTVTVNTKMPDGGRLYGTLTKNVRISIAEGATVTLEGATINGTADESYRWGGINCEGDATIILKDGTTNSVTGFYQDHPGIQAGPDGSTLTIKGAGSLTATSNGQGAGIGGGNWVNCGNIVIAGGTITATGSNYAAGIGGGNDAACGDISITGGTVTAQGGEGGAGIGNGSCSARGSSCGNISITGGTVTAKGGAGGAGIGSGRANAAQTAKCGNITIASTVTQVTATLGSGATNSIGAGQSSGGTSTCGTVTIGSSEGAITTSPYNYTPLP